MTTIVSVRRGRQVCMGGDGQVSLGSTILKPNAKKVRRLRKNSVLAGFAGCTADAFALFDIFEKKLELHQGLLQRAAVEFAKDWRTNRDLRRLEATLTVADLKTSLIITGLGDVIQTDRDLIAIGSGAGYAKAAAEALLDHTEMDATAIVKKSLSIAGSICIYTNQYTTIETLELPEEEKQP